MKVKKKKNYKGAMGSVVLNKMMGNMSVHFYPEKTMTIKKGEKLFLEGQSFTTGLNPNTFFNKVLYRVPIIEAYNLGKRKKLPTIRRKR